MSVLFVFVDFSLGYVCSFPNGTKPVVFVFLVVLKNFKLQTRQPSTHEQAASCPQSKIGQGIAKVKRTSPWCRGWGVTWAKYWMWSWVWGSSSEVPTASELEGKCWTGSLSTDPLKTKPQLLSTSCKSVRKEEPHRAMLLSNAWAPFFGRQLCFQPLQGCLPWVDCALDSFWGVGRRGQQSLTASELFIERKTFYCPVLCHYMVP